MFRSFSFAVLTLAAVTSVAAADIQGKVTLDPKLAESAAPDDTVYIFARAIDGPRMPLAMIKAKFSDLPLDFTLDNSTTTTPNIRLSDFGQVRVIARVARSGGDITEHADLEGESNVINGDARGVSIIIDSLSQ